MKWVKRTLSATLAFVLIVGLVGYINLPTVKAAGTSQVLIGGTSAAIFNNSQYAIAGFGDINNSSAAENVMPVAGTISNFRYDVSAAPGGAATRTLTMKKNSVATSIACTIASAATSCTDNTDTVSVVAGDNLSLNTTAAGTPAGADGSWSMVFTPTNSNDGIILSATNLGGSKLTVWWPFSEGTVNASAFNSETLATQVFPEAGTVDTLFATTTSITAGSALESVFQNDATSTLQCTIGVGTYGLFGCADTVDSLTIAKGDTFSLGQLPSSPTGNIRGGFAVRFVPTTLGDYDFFGTTDQRSDTAGSTVYIPINGPISAYSSPVTVEASTTAAIAAAATFSSMQVLRSVAPGSAKNATVTLRVNNVNSTLSCTLTGTGSGDGITTKTCTGSVSVNPGDLLDYSIALDTGGTTGTWRIGLVANNASSSVSPTRHMRLFEGFKIKLIGKKLKLLQK